MKSRDSIKQAVLIAGGQSALARKLHQTTGHHYRPGHVWLWLNRNKKIPPEVAIPIERITDGLVTRFDLLPDVFGERPPDSPNTMHHKSQGQLLSEGERA